MHTLLANIQQFLVAYGYWGVLLGLLGENAGLPLPGETILLLASFLAYQHHQLHLQWIIVVGICAATIGDNIGYLIGHYGGRPLLNKWKGLFRISDESIQAAEDFLRRRGWVAVFLARFIAGMRIVGGPLAGVLGMPWTKFVSANAAGAIVWVSVISMGGYFFGNKLHSLLVLFKGAQVAILVAIVAGWLLWRHRRKSKQRERLQAARN
jgi:membrane-associated protein